MAILLQPTQVGIREELADYIAVVDAKSTPLTSMMPKGKDIGNMRFDWQVDSYDQVRVGGVVDGTDAVTGNLTNASKDRARLGNYAQVFRRDFRVGFIAETQNVAGVSDEVARSVSKRMLELKRDMEATISATNQAAQADAGVGVPYLTASLGQWLTGNTGTTGPAGAVGNPPSTFATPAASKYLGTTAALTETNVQAILTSIYNQTGTIRSYDVIAGTTLKRAFTNLTNPAATNDVANSLTATSVRTFNMEISDETYRHSVDVFTGDFGTLNIHPTVFVGTITTGAWNVTAYQGYVVPIEMLELRYAKLPEVKELPDNGGGPAKLIQAIAGLVCRNPLGFGYFACSS